MTPFGEPYLGDGRLSAIEGRLRRDYPALPESAEFVTYVQPATWLTRADGLEYLLPPCAVLMVVAHDPRNAKDVRLFQIGDTVDNWRSREWFTRHDSTVESDPAYAAFRRLVPQVIDWTDAIRTLN